jgi:predicted DNA-binding WGR domain protein
MNEKEIPLKETLWFVGENYQGYGKKPVQSDKVYVVELYSDAPANLAPNIAKTFWSVKASWGRRGKAFQSQVKVQQGTYWYAAQKFHELVLAKRDKGYKKWEFVTEVETMHIETGYDS